MDVFEASSRGYKHKNLLFWIGMIESMASPIRAHEKVLDFGCGHGLFLQLLFDIHPYKHGIGVDIDNESIKIANQLIHERSVDWPIQYLINSEFNEEQYAEAFDVIFCQEVFWMNRNLSELAKKLYAMLKEGGRCYCTMGSHTKNPLWSHRRELMEAEGMETNTYALDDVARIFSEAGFVVGMRRLPISGFVMYNPETTPIKARSFSELVSSTHEHKMLFYFGKYKQNYQSEGLQG